MSRVFGSVYSSFWSSKTIAALSDDGKILALYLMTCSHRTIIGAFRLPDGYIAEDIGWPVDRIQRAFAELSREGFALRCESTKWVWIVKHLIWNRPENPNQMKSVRKAVGGLPAECSWLVAFRSAYPEQFGNGCARVDEQLIAPQEQLQEQFVNQQQQQHSQQQKQHPQKPPRGRVVDEGRFPEFWGAWPPSERRQDRKKCAQKWIRAGLDAEADAILEHVAAMAKTKKWRDGYDPAPLTYLNGERWKDGVGVESPAAEEFI